MSIGLAQNIESEQRLVKIQKAAFVPLRQDQSGIANKTPVLIMSDRSKLAKECRQLQRLMLSTSFLLTPSLRRRERRGPGSSPSIRAFKSLHRARKCGYVMLRNEIFPSLRRVSNVHQPSCWISAEENDPISFSVKDRPLASQMD